MAKTSRAKIASYFAAEIVERKPNVIPRLTALIIDENRLRELELIVTDIEYELNQAGIIIADVTSAERLSEGVEESIRALLTRGRSPEKVLLREHVDPHLIGGIRIRSAGRELDTSVRHKLNVLKSEKL
jgi:F0F1-type ATP synthase delta subunit